MELHSRRCACSSLNYNAHPSINAQRDPQALLTATQEQPVSTHLPGKPGGMGDDPGAAADGGYRPGVILVRAVPVPVGGAATAGALLCDTSRRRANSQPHLHPGCAGHRRCRLHWQPCGHPPGGALWLSGAPCVHAPGMHAPLHERQHRRRGKLQVVCRTCKVWPRPISEPLTFAVPWFQVVVLDKLEGPAALRRTLPPCVASALLSAPTTLPCQVVVLDKLDPCASLHNLRSVCNSPHFKSACVCLFSPIVCWFAATCCGVCALLDGCIIGVPGCRYCSPASSFRVPAAAALPSMPCTIACCPPCRFIKGDIQTADLLQVGRRLLQSGLDCCDQLVLERAQCAERAACLDACCGASAPS